MAQASFFYYNPESGSDSRQHDLFTPQPSAILRSSPLNPQDASLQHLYMPSMAARSLVQKAAFLPQEAHILSVDTEFSAFDDLSGYPRTPSLSTSSSAVSSPPQSHCLPTPTNGFFEHLTGVKEGCEHDVKSEILASSFDFSRAGSPPLTPVFVNPPNVTAAGSSQASELLSTSSCPSLSPSPSPAPQSIASQAEHFCDPRNLLVNSRSTPLINQLEIPTLPAFIPSNDDLLLGLHGVHIKPIESSSVLDPIPPEVESVPFFDSLDDLDSETDFITDLSQETGLYAGVKRHRLDSVPFSEEYLSESSFDDDWMSMSPLSQADSVDMKSRKSGKHSAKKQKLDDNSVDFDFGSTYAGSADANAATSVSGVSGQDSKEAAIAPASDASTPSGQQANRRGRKQSLTDDPSKTFVCTLCSRRFRRQEHLKRHYRSLHTQDKPFECSDCGKKFSRSDNLAQHARTHGNTTTIVGLNMPELDEKTASMSAHLFETVTAVSSSSSSNGSDDEKAAKKRKRDE